MPRPSANITDGRAAGKAAPPGGKPLPLTLRAYRTATALATPVASLLLALRGMRGKEVRGRRGERYGQASIARPAGPLVWFHAASVGETSAVMPLLHKLAEDRPDIFLLLTTGTRTSARVAEERLPEGALHQFVPLDVPAFVRRFLDHWRPDMGVFAESEIWPNLLIEAHARGVRLALVNGRLSVRSFGRWRRRPATSLALFGRFDQVLAQSDRHAARFRELGAPHVVATGNLKIDAPVLPANRARRLVLEKAIKGRPVFIAASTHEGEEDIVADAHGIASEKLTRLLTIVAPRHPDRGKKLAARLRARGLEVAQRSVDEEITPATDIYLADTIGELGVFYALAPLAFIGGSMVPHGGQNPVEAMRHDCVVMTGPYVQNFEDIYEALYDGDACVEVGSASELAAEAVRLLSDKDQASAMRKAGGAALRRMEGALERSFTALTPSLPVAAKEPERTK